MHSASIYKVLFFLLIIIKSIIKSIFPKGECCRKQSSNVNVKNVICIYAPYNM